MSKKSNSFCLKHSVFFENDICPLCLIDGDILIDGFRLEIAKDSYNKASAELDEGQTKRWGRNKPYDWKEDIANYLSMTEENDKVILRLDPKKLFDKGEIEIPPTTYVNVVANLSAYAPEIIIIQAEEISKMSDTLRNMWQVTLLVEFDENLHILTKNPTIKDIRLNCWKNVKKISGRNINGQFEASGYKLQLERPMHWRDDIEKLMSHSFKIELTTEIEQQLEELAKEEQIERDLVEIIPHEDGISISLYRHIEDNYKTRLEKNCSLVYWINKDMGDYETLKFIERKGIEDKRLIYMAKYFILPTITNYFKREGFNVVVDPSLYGTPKKFDFDVKANFKLWPEIQTPAVQAWIDNGETGTIVIPTGGGKTIVALKIIEQLKEWTLIVVPTIDLKNQWIEFLTGYNHEGKPTNKPHLNVPLEQIGEIYGGRKDIKPITIALPQTTHKYFDEKVDDKSVTAEKLGKFGEELGKISKDFSILITDEGHHMAAMLWKKIIIHMRTLKRLSLTATPERYDGNETLLFFAMGDTVYSTTYGEMAKAKKVSPIKFQRERVPLNSYEEKMLTIMAKLYSNFYYSDSDKQKAKDELLELYMDHPYILHREADYIARVKKAQARGRKLKEQFIVKRASIRIIHLLAEAKYDKLVEILKKHENEKILIFNEFVHGVYLIDEKLKENNIKAEIIMGNVPEVDRKRILEDFRKNSKGIILTTTVLEEGIDVPECSVIIIFNGRRVRRQMIQRIGRGCRYKPFKIEHVYEIITASSDELAETTEEIKTLLKRRGVGIGDSLYIIGGHTGRYGDEVKLLDINGAEARIEDKEGKVYNKNLRYLSTTMMGNPIYLRYRTYRSGWQYELQKLINYETEISQEREPSEVLEIEEQEKLIAEIMEQTEQLPICVIEDCEEKIFAQNGLKREYCSEHQKAWNYIVALKTRGIMQTKDDLLRIVERNQHTKDIYNHLKSKVKKDN